MYKISFEDQAGYAFSKYLSPVPVHQGQEVTETYISRLKKQFPDAGFSSNPNDPNFQEGVTDTFTLPAIGWHKAVYLISAMYLFPKSFGCLNPVCSKLASKS
ncbi:MAG: hypothetical protein ACJAU2_001232 [Maribacter sp.]|jgi:hypothetical protein